MNSLEHFKAALKEGGFLLLFNALGVGIYLAFESSILAPRSEEDALNGIDQIVLWMQGELPLMVLCFGVNMMWLISMRRKRAISTSGQVSIWLLVCAAWTSALVYHGLAIKIIGIVVDMIDGRAWK